MWTVQRHNKYNQCNKLFIGPSNSANIHIYPWEFGIREKNILNGRIIQLAFIYSINMHLKVKERNKYLKNRFYSFYLKSTYELFTKLELIILYDTYTRIKYKSYSLFYSDFMY